MAFTTGDVCTGLAHPGATPVNSVFAQRAPAGEPPSWGGVVGGPDALPSLENEDEGVSGGVSGSDGVAAAGLRRAAPVGVVLVEDAEDARARSSGPRCARCEASEEAVEGGGETLVRSWSVRTLHVCAIRTR